MSEDQMSKALLLELLKSRRAEWDAVLAEVPVEAMTEPGAAGTWSVKDLVAHLNFFESWYGDRLHEQLEGIQYTPTELDWMPFDQRNEIIYQQNRDRPVEEVLAESRVGFQRLLAGVQANPESFLIDPQQFPGAPEPVTIWKMLRGDVYEHYGEHIASIRQWLAARSSA